MSTHVHHEVVLHASPAQVYEALMDSTQHSAFTGGAPADISREVGGAWSAFGGQIHGRNLEIVENQRIVQAWRSKGWGEGIYSVVKFELGADGENTRVVLDHTAIPDGEFSHLDTGWTNMYWTPLKKHFP